MQLSLPVLSNVGITTGAPVVVGEGGLYLYIACGTFGGATVKLQILGPDGVTYVDVPGSSMTVGGGLNVQLPSGSTVRGSVAAGAPSAIFASLGFVSQ